MSEDNYQDNRQRQGSSGAGLPVASQLAIQAKRVASNRSRESLSVFDATNDLIWANGANTSKAPHSYFDYFFTGQDILCYIDGAGDMHMPIMDFAFNIQQQKIPVFGFWSYTFDAVMRGNRTVTGMFRIATTSTDYLTNHISKAAKSRSEKDYDYVLRGLDKDEENIEKYWSRNVDPDTIDSGGKNLFSSHPPFNMVVVYGLQSSSITSDPSGRMEEVRSRYNTDTPLMTDINERLVSTNSDNAMRFVIENIEITAMQVEFTPSGEVCSEVYSFFARDITTPKTGTNPNRGGSVYVPY